MPAAAGWVIDTYPGAAEYALRHGRNEIAHHGHTWVGRHAGSGWWWCYASSCASWLATRNSLRDQICGGGATSSRLASSFSHVRDLGDGPA
jgi:hypothetical protein